MLQTFPRFFVMLGALTSVALLGLVGCGPTDTGKTEGSLKISASIEASAPKTGQNTLMIEVKDKDGNAIKDATITVMPHMPAHGHGSTEEPKLENMGEGKYKAFPVTFQMPGDWEIIVEAKVGTEAGKYTLNVQVQ